MRKLTHFVVIGLILGRCSPVGVAQETLGCKTGESLYLVGWTEIATKGRLDGMTEARASRDAMLKQAGGAVLLTSNDISHDGSRGIEFRPLTSIKIAR
jgi:hypothetical protein